MILPDLNLLLYSYNPFAAQHAAALKWWEEVINGEELIALPHEISFGFIRIATNARLGEAAVSLSEARAVVDSWLNLPQSRIVLPDDDHFRRTMKLMEGANASGSVLSDAVLASYAIANRAVLHSNDADFSRFPGLKWTNPLMDV